MPWWDATEKNSVPITAMPIAPPSCCIAFSTPEAEPTSWSSTPASAKSNSGASIAPMPMPAAAGAIRNVRRRALLPPATLQREPGGKRVFLIEQVLAHPRDPGSAGDLWDHRGLATDG